MKLEIFTTIKKAIASSTAPMTCLTALLLLLTIGTVSAQSLTCNKNVQVSLDNDCIVDITPGMILEGEPTNPTELANYEVRVLDSNDRPINAAFSNRVTRANIGQTLKVEVIYTPTQNKCWGTIKVEDKLPPVFDCPRDTIVNCYRGSLDFAKPIATDGCDGIVATEIVSDKTDDMGCSDDYSGIRVITYQAKDAQGNTSYCTRRILFKRVGLYDVRFPSNRDDIDLPVFECDVNSNPSLEEAGVPYAVLRRVPNPVAGRSDTLISVPGVAGMTHTEFEAFRNDPANSDLEIEALNSNKFCELNVTHKDDTLHICESSYKVLRKWTILDWCTSVKRDTYQIVKVLDKEGPLLSCPVNRLGTEDGLPLDADPYTCTATWNVVKPTVIFDCSSWTYSVAYALAGSNGEPLNGIYETTNVQGNSVDGYTISDLPLGETWIKYTVTDDCGNVAYCFTEIEVVDNTPPVPVCDEHTVVTLTPKEGVGEARVYAKTFDDGSHDNCSAVTFKVRRMNNACPTHLDEDDEGEWFDYVHFCCEDLARNDIMVILQVTDASGNTNTCMVDVKVQNKIIPTLTCPVPQTISCQDYSDYVDYTDAQKATKFGEPTIVNSICRENLAVRDIPNLNDCGVGTITRRWELDYGGVSPAVCNQTIFVRNLFPFNDGVVDSQPDTDIAWPRDTLITSGCKDLDTHPDKTGRPDYTDDECSQLATSMEDQVFTFVEGACLKILRRWTVIDWCQYNQNLAPEHPNQRGYWTHTQIIKVSNQNAPEFTNCNRITVDAFGQDCAEDASIIVNANDDCTPENELRYTYVIKDKNDVTIVTGNSNNASRRLPVAGSPYKVYWTVEDQCGNENTCTQEVIVQDRKKPTPYCISKITTVVMPSTGSIAIWAKDFNLASTDNCTGESDLRYTFTSTPPENDPNYDAIKRTSSRTFDCGDIGEQILDMYVFDLAGNKDYCTVKINIQSNDGCDGVDRIAGNIHTEGNQAVGEVSVGLDNMTSGESTSAMTTGEGNFQFAAAHGANFMIKPKKNDNPLNGVNTLDIVKIQRHLLEIKKLDSPYKRIAADANGDGEIKASDLLTIRKLILGLTTEFAGNQSWRFVNTEEPFADPTNPFPFVEEIEIRNFNGDMMHNDFMAVKVGDVDASATANFDSEEATTRSGNTVVFEMTEQAYTAGDIVSIPVRLTTDESIIGLQMAFDIEGLEVASIESSVLDITDDNVAISEDRLIVSWNDVSGATYGKGDELFVIHARATDNSVASQAISIASQGLHAEMYSAALEASNIAVQFRGNADEGFKVLQNTPNPFVNETIIAFSLPESGQATLKVYDITGKVLTTQQNTYSKGLNQIRIDADAIAASGVLYYQLAYNGEVVTKKMIKVSK